MFRLDCISHPVEVGIGVHLGYEFMSLTKRKEVRG